MANLHSVGALMNFDFVFGKTASEFQSNYLVLVRRLKSRSLKFTFLLLQSFNIEIMEKCASYMWFIADCQFKKR